MPAYITQNEAALFAETLGSVSAMRATVLLTAASTMLDQFTGRTFTGAELTDSVKAGIAMCAEWMATSNPAGGTIIKEKIGDYDASYATPEAGSIPVAIQMLWAPYKIVAVG
jgi:hypothetical protein